MTGTCSTWRCVDCGEVWTWRNTPESARCTAEVARHHRLVEVAP